MRIEQLMSRPPITCRGAETANVAAQRMWEHDCGMVLVVDDDGKLIGVVTDRDLCMAAYTMWSPLQAIRVADVMAEPVGRCAAQDPVEAAERTMRQSQIPRVPVTDAEGRPVGVLSIADLVRQAAAAGNRADPELVQTLATVCAPRVGGPCTAAARFVA